MGNLHESDKALVKELMTVIDVAIADWYNTKIQEIEINREGLMRAVDEAVYQYYVANRRS